MEKKNLVKISFWQALGVVVYVFLVTRLMSFGGQFASDPKGLFGPVAFLTLFVVSAAVTGYLVVGKSFLWYLDGAKKEAVKLFGLTVMWLVVFMLLAFAGMGLRG